MTDHRRVEARRGVSGSASLRDDMDLPGFRLHLLKGDRSGTWAVTVRANWRVTFRFAGDDVADVQYEDYH